MGPGPGQNRQNCDNGNGHPQNEKINYSGKLHKFCNSRERETMIKTAMATISMSTLNGCILLSGRLSGSLLAPARAKP